jgi:hypothetical protein
LSLFLAGDNARLQAVCTALSDFLEFQGRWDEWFALCEKAEASSLSALTIAERREDEARGENRARSAVDANISRSPSAESDIPSG